MIFFFTFDALQCLLLVNLAYKSVDNFKKNPNIVQSSSIAVPVLYYWISLSSQAGQLAFKSILGTR